MSSSHSESHFDGNHENNEFSSVEEFLGIEIPRKILRYILVVGYNIAYKNINKIPLTYI